MAFSLKLYSQYVISALLLNTILNLLINSGLMHSTAY